MTGNAQIDHRKYFKFFTLTTACGQFESLQGVLLIQERTVPFRGSFDLSFFVIQHYNTYICLHSLYVNFKNDIFPLTSTVMLPKPCQKSSKPLTSILPKNQSGPIEKEISD